jgi:hypothetical protein
MGLDLELVVEAYDHPSARLESPPRGVPGCSAVGQFSLLWSPQRLRAGESAQGGAKNRFAELEAAVARDPVRFVTVAAQTLPKDVNVKHVSTDAFLQLWKLISDGQAETALARVASREQDEQSVH